MKIDFADVCCYVILFMFLVLLVLACIDSDRMLKAPRCNGVVVKKFTNKVAVRVAYDYEFKGKVLSSVQTCYLSAEEYASISVGDLVEYDEKNKPVFESKKGE